MSQNHLHWQCHHFTELTNVQLYEMLQLRQKVFVVEQQCPYLDADGVDVSCYHLLGYENNTLVAHARLLPQGLKYEEASIGRVVTDPSARGKGFGKELMRQALLYAEQLFGKVPLRIGAQQYLTKFYNEFGFVQDSDTYLEDNISHIEMLRK